VGPLTPKVVPCLVKVPNEMLASGGLAAQWEAFELAALREQARRLEEAMRPPTPAEAQARRNTLGG
jgi:hypothetical protein